MYMPLPMPRLLLTIAALVLGPTIYQLLRRKPFEREQMWLCTLGFVLSLPLAAYVFIPAWFMTDSGTWLGIIIAASITLYFPLVLLGLIIGWRAFRSRRSRLAAWMMLLPALDAMVFLIIAFYFTFD